jgi:hypothetical protein
MPPRTGWRSGVPKRSLTAFISCYMAVSIARINAVRHAQLLGDQAARQEVQDVRCRVEASDLIGIVGVGGTLDAGVGNRQAAGIVDVILRRLAAACCDEMLHPGIVCR